MKKSLITLALGLAMSAGAMAQDIVDVAVKAGSFKTLVAAVQAAGLVDTLKGPGPFTVFAPINSGFAALPAGTVEGLLKPEAHDTLVKILTCHVVAGKVMSKAAMAMIKADGGKHKVKTVGGCELTLSMKGPDLIITDEAGGSSKVIIANVRQSNGVIHVIDKVLLPKM